MIQHPIPQNISTYQFRLVGDMTLKQFLELVGGLVVGAVFFYSNLFGPLKFIFVILSGLMGVALAFMPVEERPLDQWLLAFIKAIYAPTLFIWRKSVVAPGYFSFTPHSTLLPPETQELMAAQIARKKAGLSTFLMTLPQSPAISNLEAQESASLNRVMGYFLVSPFTAPTPLKTPITPRPTHPISIPQTPIIATIPTLARPKLTSEGGPAPWHPLRPIAPFTPPAKTGDISVPTLASIKIAPVARPQTPLPLVTNAATPQPLSTTFTAAKTAPSAAAATTQKNLPFPSPPQTTNTVVGMVLDSQDKIIDNAIIEIRDKDGIPVRATKTNRLGQFFSTTPLKNGVYEVEVEAPGHTFSVVKLNLTNKIIDPLKIQSSN